jgi:hypothetical protein
VGGQAVVGVGGDAVVAFAGFADGIHVDHSRIQIFEMVDEPMVDFAGDAVPLGDG